MKADWREQYDLSTSHPQPGPDKPLYHNLLAPNQWPPQEYMPEFRSTFEEYMVRMTEISTFFTSLIAEAIGLPPTAFDSFFDKDQQHKLKVRERERDRHVHSFTAIKEPNVDPVQGRQIPR